MITLYYLKTAQNEMALFIVFKQKWFITQKSSDALHKIRHVRKTPLHQILQLPSKITKLGSLKSILTEEKTHFFF